MIKSKKNLLFVLFSLVMLFSFAFSLAIRPVGATGEDTSVADGAEIRNSLDRTGIRFTAFVDNKYFSGDELAENTVAGMLIYKGTAEASDITVETADVMDIKAEVFDASKSTDNAKAFNAVVYGIPESGYAQKLTARSYVGVYNGETYDYTYSENVVTRSAAEVASAALIAGEEDENEILKNYVDGTNPVITVAGEKEGAITLKLGETKEVISVEPAIGFKAESADNSVVTVNGGALTVIKASATPVNVTVTVGSTGKTFAVNVKGYLDATLATGVLADFDDDNYMSMITASKASIQIANDGNLSNTGANGIAISGKFAAITPSAGYNAVDFSFCNPINVSEVPGIYIKAKLGWKALDDGMYLRVNGKGEYKFDYIQKRDNTQYQWVYYYIPSGILYEVSGHDTVIESVGLMFTDASSIYGVDEIGIMADDVYSALYTWECGVNYINSTDESCPAGGSGVVAVASPVQGAGTSFPIRIALGKTYKVSDIKSITLRVAKPAGAGGYGLYVMGYDGFAYSEKIQNAGQGGWTYDMSTANQFYDITFDVTNASGASLNDGTTIGCMDREYLSFIWLKYHGFNTTTNNLLYIDSVTVTLK